MTVDPSFSPALTLVTQPATRRERRLSGALVAALVACSIAAVPLRHAAFGIANAFIPAFAGTTGTADALAAAMLFALFAAEGNPAMLFAGAAYLIDAMLIVPYALTFPNVVTPTGFVGNEQSAAWLWVCWHLTFPMAVALGTRYARVVRAPERRATDMLRVGIAAAALAIVTSFAVTSGRDLLPVLVSHGRFSTLFTVLALVASLAAAACIAVLATHERRLHTLQLWLVVAATASMLDTALNSVAPARYSFAWYVGKFETFVTASVVLVSLLSAWSQLYARAKSLALRLSAASADRERLQERLEREHDIALALQTASLPRVLPAIDGIALRAVYRPAESDLEIGGDWYDAFVLGDGRVAITVGDVAGKGLAASVIMGKVRHTLRVAAQLHPEPIVMLAIADRALRAEHPDTMVTAFVGILDDRHDLEWATAGHPSPLLRAPDGTIAELYGPAPPLGLRNGVAATTRTTHLERGSLLAIYTDGLIEAGRDYLDGMQRLGNALRDPALALSADPATTLHDRVVATHARDDIAIVTLAVAG